MYLTYNLHSRQLDSLPSNPNSIFRNNTNSTNLISSIKMQLTIAAFVAVLAHLQTTLALPASMSGTVEDRQAPYIPCSGLYGTTQCCATDVLGLVDLDCGNRKFHRPNSLFPRN